MIFQKIMNLMRIRKTFIVNLKTGILMICTNRWNTNALWNFFCSGFANTSLQYPYLYFDETCTRGRFVRNVGSRLSRVSSCILLKMLYLDYYFLIIKYLRWVAEEVMTWLKSHLYCLS